MKTGIEICIDDLKKIAMKSTNITEFEAIDDCIVVLKENLKYERFRIEMAFEDGVGEGLTDPERPLTGKEYYDIKYKK
jgi:hypothetical protein